jgi:hypothetical protein
MTESELPDSLRKWIEIIGGQVLDTQCRLIAIQKLLANSGTLSEADVTRTMNELHEETEFSVEFGPEYESYRQLRQIIREAGGEPPPPEGT